jgi:gliding motility-associated-like protein
MALFAIPAIAQKETNNWYFGRFSGIRFDQTPPAPIAISSMITEEGCASISDRDGNLLFYTNGLVIINAQNQVMPNGNALRGDRSSTQNAVIVPAPGHDSLYYIFTVGAEYQANNGLHYAIVNMKRDNGLGDVVFQSPSLCNTCMEKIAAVRHCNKRDFWIVTQAFNTNVYQVYLLNAAGVQPVLVVSGNGFMVSGQTVNTIGAIKFSSDGKKMVAVHGYTANTVELLDFDHSTGQLSNPVLFNPIPITGINGGSTVYGAEFSPDSKYLYLTGNDYTNDSAFLYQVNITNHNAAAIMASRQRLSVNLLNSIGNIQAGPDQKLYVTYFNAATLGVINQPNTGGLGCDYVRQGQSIGAGSNRNTQGGLPTFVASFFNPASQPFDFTRSEEDCTNRTISFTLSRQTGMDSVRWFFGDGQTTTVLNPTHTFTGSGSFNIRLIVYKIDCSGQNDTIQKTVWIAPNSNLLGADRAACAVVKQRLETNISNLPDTRYLWNTGSTAPSIEADTSGLYWVRVTRYGCTLSDSLNIVVLPAPVVSLGADTTLCPGERIVLQSDATGEHYTWNTGAISQTLPVNKPGTYSIAVSRNGCTGRDTVKVEWGDCPLWLPTAFTPNGDGKNDAFGPYNPSSYSNFQLIVFNRWGQAVFTTRDPGNKWNGDYRGLPAPTGAYTWQIVYTNRRGVRKSIKGMVTLIR